MRKTFTVLLLLLLVRSGVSQEHLQPSPEESTTARKTRPKDPPFYNIKKSDGAVGFNYYKFTLIRIDNDLFALHVLPDPRFANGKGITYRWYSTNDGSGAFISHKPYDGETPDPNVTVGSGDTHEIDYGIGEVSISQTKLKWSFRNDHSGWLYVRNTNKAISVYPEQFDEFGDFPRRLNDNRWIPMSVAKQEDAEQSGEPELPSTVSH